MIASILRNMRYAPEHKAEVHQQIVKDAARQVRAEGLTGAGVATIMRSTGLTHGGFYKHFESKDELLTESVAEAFRDFAEKLASVAKDSGSEAPWRAIIKEYLSVKHCKHVEQGCPLSALAPEMARANPKMKGQIVSEILQYKSRMVPFMPGRRAAEKERNFFVMFSAMIGAMEIARILPDSVAQEKVLSSTREFLLATF
jgi:TetR/AcrR family transcriptional regulator, transcriptional repressor for nem operon